MTTPLIEAIARAIYESVWVGEYPTSGIEHAMAIQNARAALTAITEAGMVIVPVDAFQALDASHIALDDWLHIYAADQCRDEHVATSRARIAEAGGTLAYIADLQQQNRRVLNEMWAISGPLDTKEGE